MDGKNMNCTQVKEMLSLYIDDKLDEVSEQQVKAHFNACVSCRQEYKLLTGAIALLQELPELPVPADFDGRLRAELIKESKWMKENYHLGYVSNGRKKAQPLAFVNWKKFSVAAAACLVLIAGAGMYSQGILNELIKYETRTDITNETTAQAERPQDYTGEGGEAAARRPVSPADTAGDEAGSIGPDDTPEQDLSGAKRSKAAAPEDQEESAADTNQPLSEDPQKTQAQAPDRGAANLDQGGGASDQTGSSLREGRQADAAAAKGSAADSPRRQTVESRLQDTFTLRMVDAGTLKYSLASYTKIDENHEVFVYNIEGVKNGLPVTKQLRIQASGEGDALTLTAE